MAAIDEIIEEFEAIQRAHPEIKSEGIRCSGCWSGRFDCPNCDPNPDNPNTLIDLNHYVLARVWLRHNFPDNLSSSEISTWASYEFRNILRGRKLEVGAIILAGYASGFTVYPTDGENAILVMPR